MIDEIDIPAHTDDMPSFLLWELDEFLVLMLCFLGGYIARGMWPFVGAAIGLWFTARMRRWKQNEMMGAIPHIVFAAGWAGINKLYRNAKHGVLWS
ncbi:type IV conjugative transfer system protein TraL [Achromobacter sp.]|uniref:type IV conjugative transfer system protein TraL n=1 Tax=Achromobacter sp. TaxID=134375 RepID=UPI0028AFFE26|nr:type IV conjugative transfer system protein TraL [Achromobacter sp.]